MGGRHFKKWAGAIPENKLEKKIPGINPENQLGIDPRQNKNKLKIKSNVDKIAMYVEVHIAIVILEEFIQVFI